MRLYRSAVAPWRTVLLVVALAAMAVPSARAVDPGNGKKSRYVVVLDDSKANAGAVADKQARKHGFEVGGLFERGVRGYVGTMTPAVASLLARADGVRAVAPDTRVTKDDTPPIVTQSLPTSPSQWGLDRIDQRNLPLNRQYQYNMTGSGVTAYVVDTGIRSSHSQFGGRVDKDRRYDAYRDVEAADYGEDCDGHGTHVAGTVGGSTYGVAKDVKLISVRILDCNGSGYVSDIVNGIGWMIADHATGTPAVANMSFGGSRNSALDAAVQNAVNDGITVAVAAGNSNRDACSYSPARAAAAITVGATDSSDRRASYSNYGSCLDVFAPGSGIVSAGSGGDSAWASMSGTSMAAPHVAGVAAVFLSALPSAGPATLRDALVAVATSGKVISSSTSSPKLLYAPANLTAGELPTVGTSPSPTTSSSTTSSTATTTTTKPPVTTTTRAPTTTTTTRCWLLCNWRP